MRLFSRYCSILEKSIMIFLLYELYDIAEVAIQYGADFRQNLCTDMLVLAQLGKGGRRHAGSQTQILLFHVFINQEFPQLIITNRHRNTSCQSIH
jgi:hypothetical protein